jgi:AcrR family transcriptional regulator
MSEVKGIGTRSARAAETRRRVVEAARDLFVDQGYGATVLPDVARRAGVSVQTIYFTFGNKRTLLKEVVDVAVAGDLEPIATLERPWFRDALAADDAAGVLARYVEGAGEILRRVAPVMKVVAAAAATDPEVADMWPADVDPRLVVVRRAVDTLIAKPGARPEVSPDWATDVVYALLSPELYLVLVADRGWSHDQWLDWAGATLSAQLTGPAVGPTGKTLSPRTPATPTREVRTPRRPRGPR